MGRMLIKLLILWVAIALIQMHGYKGCLEKERTALLEIKAFFKSVSNWQKHRILASWVDDRMSDCCGWERVKCNATTGRVIELSLNHARQSNYADGDPILNLSLFRHFDELESLDLSVNFFEGWDENKDDYSSLTQLKKLDLSFGNFNSSLFSYLSGLTSLSSLILRSSLAEGIKSEQGLKNLKNLEILDLSGNGLSGSLTWLGLENLKNLEILDLGWNQKNISVTSLGLQNLKNLKILNLERNGINGSLTWLGICELKNLVELNLMENEIHGELPHCLSNLTYLRLLDLSSNQLSGSFSSVIATLTSLDYLSLSYNNFKGLFSFSSLANLSKLEVFTLSTQNNLLQVETETQLPISQLKVLTLANCNLHGSISGFLLNQYNLRLIDLSSNKLDGKFPAWLLQNNTKLESMLLMNNSFTGILQVPKSKHGLIDLDISNNNFSGQLPENMGIENDDEERYDELYYYGGGGYDIDVYYNSTWHFMEYFDSYEFISRPAEVELVTKNRYDTYKGNILDYMTGLDLSSNELNGDIPSEIGDLQEIHALNLSNNSLSGSIPKSFSSLKHIESLDLSYNKLIGEIPPQLTELYNLEIFNVSYNNLSGSIPNKNQFGSFEESTYFGNPHLCGPPIKEMCTSTLVPPTSSSTEEEEEEGDSTIDMVAFYWSFAASYVTIILVSMVILWLNSYWRSLWFCFVDKCISFDF